MKREVDLPPTSATLVAGTRYELTLYAAPEMSGGGVLSYDGVALAQPYQIEFGVLDTDGGPTAYDTGPVGDHFLTGGPPGCDAGTGGPCSRSVSDILSTCALGGCHGFSSTADPAAAGLPSEDLPPRQRQRHRQDRPEQDRPPRPRPARRRPAAGGLAPLRPEHGGALPKRPRLQLPRLQAPRQPAPRPRRRRPPRPLLQQSIVVGMPMPPTTGGPPSDAQWLTWLLQGAPWPPRARGGDAGVCDGGDGEDVKLGGPSPPHRR